MTAAAVGVCAALAGQPPAFAQAYGTADSANPASLPYVTVSAEKVPENAQLAPVSVTAVTAAEMKDRGVVSVRDAALYAPNANLVEYTARAISIAEFRGVGGSPTNPGVTTYIDGVPQLNADTSSVELFDTEQMEFVRGSQGTLYGRNTLGGVINIRSRAPGLVPRASIEQGFGNYQQRDIHLSLSGPLTEGDELAGSLAGGISARDGYTINDFTGRDLDSRAAMFGRAQLLFRLSEHWDARLIAGGEDAHDGDFALGDLDALRARPHHVDHDFTGYTRRAISDVTGQVHFYGDRFDFSSVTGAQGYRAFETTDLDVSPQNELTRQNHRKALQLTQEFGFNSSEDAPLRLTDNLALRWQTGLFLFRQNNNQQVTNFINSAFLVENGGSFLGVPFSVPQAPFIPLPLNTPPAQDRLFADLRDRGAGLYGQGTFESGGWSLALGLRYDYEHKEVGLYSPTVQPGPGGTVVPLGMPSTVNDARNYAAVSPRGSLGYKLNEQVFLYASIARGYRAGGFNPQSPSGEITFEPEHSTAYETGIKTQWLDERLVANLAVFRIDLKDLQLNIPFGSPGQFYIANAGTARNQGVELELRARPLRQWDVFAALGTLNARFGAGSMNMGNEVSGHNIPLAEPLTMNLGSEYRIALGSGTSAHLRVEFQRLGGYFYTADNTVSQSPYELLNLRSGVGGTRWSVEVWLRNALNRDYIPLAIPFTGITPSGYVGESAPPRTFGVNLSIQL
ncbi:MAG: TonB-dependent receptor [Stenotrophobium sp.]